LTQLVSVSRDLHSPPRASSLISGIMTYQETTISTSGMFEYPPKTPFSAEPRNSYRYAHLTTLMKSCTFPWLLSNIIDEKTSLNPEGVHKFIVKERCGVKIGIIGLVEQDWIATIRKNRALGLGTSGHNSSALSVFQPRGQKISSTGI
jgi:hypothetical protein